MASPDDPQVRRGPSVGGDSVVAGPSAAFLVMAAGRVVREDVEATLRRSGLSIRHVSALGHLAREPGLSYSELARRAGVTAQSMQATLGALEREGLVERRTAPGRGRAAVLHVTEAGGERLAAGRRAWDDAETRLLGSLADAERAELARVLLVVLREHLGR